MTTWTVRCPGWDWRPEALMSEPKAITVLNVDDYEPGLYARSRILRQAGFEVVEASNGAEALRLAALHKPAVALLDVNMPDMSGLEVCS